MLALGPSERVRTILASSRPASLVRSLAAQEFFLTLMDAGLEQSTPLLRYASRHQIDFVLDVDAWSRDGFDPERFARWLETFRQADAELLTRWLAEADESGVVLALDRMIRVYKLDESTDESFWPPDRTLPSLDGVYFFEGRPGIPDAALRAVWDGLGLLRESRQRAYEALLEQVLWQVPAEQEEDAWSGRESRLAERGFPSLDEALEVWAAGPEASAKGRAALAARVDPRVPAVASASGATARSAALVPPGDEGLEFLSAAMADLPPQMQERVAWGSARLGNRYAVAGLGHLGEARTHRDGLSTALAHLNLGLAVLAEGREEGFASAALASLSVFEIGHAGVGAILERVAHAHRVLRGPLAKLPRGLARLDLPMRDFLRGLDSPRPFYAHDGEERPFRAPQDLREADEHLSAAEAFGPFLTEGLRAGEGLPELDPLPATYRALKEIEWSPVVLTALARGSAGGDPRPEPFTPAEAGDWLGLLEANPSLLSDAAGALGLSPAVPYLERRLEDSTSGRAAGAPLDPARLRALLFR